MLTLLNQSQITAPLVLHPNSIKILRLGAENDHHLGAIQRRKNIRLIGGAQLILQRDAGKEHLKAFLRQLMVQVVCQNAVGRTAAVGVGFLIANKNVEGLFLLGNGQNPLLNFIDLRRFLFIDRLLENIGTGQGRLIVIIVVNGGILRTVYGRNTLTRCGILHIFNAVAAEHQRPIGLGIGGILVQNLLIDPHRFIELVITAKMIGAIIQIGTVLIIQPRQGLLRTAIGAKNICFSFGGFQCTAAHFTSTNCHFFLRTSYSKLDVF